MAIITRVGKWGHMLGIRIPKEFVDELQLKRGEVLELEASPDGKQLTIHRVKGLTPRERGEVLDTRNKS